MPAIEFEVVRQRPQLEQRVPHHRIVALEHPAAADREQRVGGEQRAVFIPTTPNPTTGFLMMFDKSELIYIDMKPEDAIKYIVSCGVIIPDEDATAQTANPR